MDTRVWHKVEEKRGVVLALTGDTLYRFEFSGNNAKREAAEAATTLAGGQPPVGVVGGSAKTIPVSAIQRVEVSHDRDTVKFHTVEQGKPVKVEFMVRTGDDAPGIARTVVERAGIEHPERSEDISVFEALLAPVTLAVICGVLWAIVYGIATGIEDGEEVNPNRGGMRGRGIKRFFVFIASMLGTNGTIAVGVLLLVAFIAWAVMRVVKRPQRLVWGPPAAA